MGKKGRSVTPRKTPKFERRKKERRTNFKTLNKGLRSKNPKPKSPKKNYVAKLVIGRDFFKKVNKKTARRENGKHPVKRR